MRPDGSDRFDDKMNFSPMRLHHPSCSFPYPVEPLSRPYGPIITIEGGLP